LEANLLPSLLAELLLPEPSRDRLLDVCPARRQDVSIVISMSSRGDTPSLKESSLSGAVPSVVLRWRVFFFMGDPGRFCGLAERLLERPRDA
jgi:hypothetical protein